MNRETVRVASSVTAVLLLCLYSTLATTTTCESFSEREACEGVVTERGACIWNVNANVCNANGEGNILLLDDGASLASVQELAADLSSAAVGAKGQQNPAADEIFCTQPAETGKCRAMLTSWYYDAEKNSCEKFIYGGCGGNANRFATAKTCAEAAEEVCWNQTKGEPVAIDSRADTVVLFDDNFYFLG